MLLLLLICSYNYRKLVLLYMPFYLTSVVVTPLLLSVLYRQFFGDKKLEGDSTLERCVRT